MTDCHVSKITAARLAQENLLFVPDCAYDAAKFLQIAKSVGLEWRDSDSEAKIKVDYSKAKSGIIVRNAELQLHVNKSSDLLGLQFFRLKDLDDSLFKPVRTLTLEELHANELVFFPRNAAEAVSTLNTLEALQCKRPYDYFSRGQMERTLANGIGVDKGLIGSATTTSIFKEISALPEVPLPPTFAKLFNDQAALIKEQAEIIRDIREYLKPGEFSFKK